MIALAMTLLGFSAAEPTRPPTQRIRLSAEDRAIYVQMITDGKAQREAEQKASGKRRRTGTVAGGSVVAMNLKMPSPVSKTPFHRKFIWIANSLIRSATGTR